MIWKHPIPHIRPMQDRDAERRGAPESARRPFDGGALELLRRWLGRVVMLFLLLFCYATMNRWIQINNRSLWVQAV